MGINLKVATYHNSAYTTGLKCTQQGGGNAILFKLTPVITHNIDTFASNELLLSLGSTSISSDGTRRNGVAGVLGVRFWKKEHFCNNKILSTAKHSYVYY